MNKIIERKATTPGDAVNFENVPPALDGIETGDLVVVANFPDTHEYTDIQRYAKDLRFVADEYIAFCFKNNLNITGIVSKDSSDVIKNIMKENGYTGGFDDVIVIEIYPDQLAFYDKIPGVKKEKAEVKTHSICEKKTNSDIINEMISMVDRPRLANLLAIANHMKDVDDKIIDLYLQKWAVAKYSWFILFDHQLVVRKPIEFKCDESEMSSMLDDLYRRFPSYVANLSEIRSNGGVEAFIENKMPAIDLYARYAPKIYKPGMKVSKFLSSLYKVDEEENDLQKRFDIELSKVMQNRIISGYVCVSIDPYDLLTTSVNQHSWTTCQKLWGNMAGANLSWLTDPNTLIAYRENGREYEYKGFIGSGVGRRESQSFGKYHFVGNSKSWRQMVHADPNTCAFLFSREYPSSMNIREATDAVRGLIEEVVSGKIGVYEWDNYGDVHAIAKSKYWGHVLYKDNTSHHYPDIGEWDDLTKQYKIKKSLIAPAGTDMSKVNISVGGDTYCLCCGKKLSNDSSSTRCGYCD